MPQAFWGWAGRGAKFSTRAQAKRPRRLVAPVVVPVFALEAFERRLFAGSNLSPSGAVANPAALDGAVDQTAASIEGQWDGGGAATLATGTKGGVAVSPVQGDSGASTGSATSASRLGAQQADSVTASLPQSPLSQDGQWASGAGGAATSTPDASGVTATSASTSKRPTAATYDPVAELDNIDQYRTTRLSTSSLLDESLGGGGGAASPKLKSTTTGGATAMSTMAATGGPTTLYSNDFEQAAGAEWSDPTLSVTPSGRQFLGEFGGGNNAVLTGGASWTPGRSGRGSAVQLDGSTGYLDVGNDRTAAFAGLGVTASAWVKFDTNPATAGSPVIVESLNTAGTGGFRLGVDGGKVYFQIGDGTGTYDNKAATGGTALASGTWYHLVGTFDGGTITTYVDGVQDRQASVAGTSMAAGGRMVIGRQKGAAPTTSLDGAVDDVQFFQRALGASEAASLPDGVTNGLIAYWKLDENTGTRAYDTAGAGHQKLTLTDLPSHNDLTISFDLFVIRSWDGNATGNTGPDIWTLTADGVTVLNTTFANGGTAKQAYPGSYPGGAHTRRTGADEFGTLGYLYNGGTTPLDAVYHLSYPVAHASSSVVFDFFARLQGIDDESWGIDNVTVTSHLSTISGPADVQVGATYTLNLDSGGADVSQWAIDWGDGSDPDEDGIVGEVVTGNPSSVTHVFTDGNVQRTITARSTDSYGTKDAIAPLSVRVYSDVPREVMIHGPDSVDQGQLYTLTLSTAMPSGRNVTGWTIDWGDGTDPDRDGTVGEWIQGNPSSASHVYLSDPGDYTIRATAQGNGETYAAAPFTVAVREALILTGPEVATVGDPLTYTVTCPPECTGAPVWTVTADGVPYATGSGSTLAFVPDRPGEYVVEVVTIKDGGALSASMGVTVSNAGANVSISGPPLAFIGRPVVFSSTVYRPAGSAGSLKYRWQVFDTNGVPLPPTYLQEGLSTFMTPSNLQPDTYKILLTVEDAAGIVATAESRFVVLEDPSEADYESGFVPLTILNQTFSSPYAIAQQVVDGDTKTVVAGTARNLAGMTLSDRYAAFVARFNSDLTLDANFGDGGIVTDALGGSPGQYYSSTAWALAVDPDSQDIVLAGSVEKSGNSHTGLVVARYLPDGKEMDGEFNGGAPWTYLPPSWGSWVDEDVAWRTPSNAPTIDWSGVPYDVTVLPDQSILVGGSMTKYWPSENSGPFQEDDFLLLKLVGRDQESQPGQPELKAGSLDPGFGRGGFAYTVNPSNIPDGATWDDLEELESQNDLFDVPGNLDHWDIVGNGRVLPPSAARISKILPVFDGNGQLTSILVGGSARDWGNIDQMSNYAEYDGTYWDFVVGRYEVDGRVDTNFGDQGKVVTDFGQQTTTYPDGRPFLSQDNFLSNIEILPNANDPNGYDILAVGTAPSLTIRTSSNDGQGGANVPEIPQCLAMAWYTSGGQMDPSFGNYIDETHHSGTLVSSIIVGGSREGSGGAAAVSEFPAITFDSDHRVIVSAKIKGTWGSSHSNTAGAHGLSLSGWALMRVDPMWSLGEDDPVLDPDVLDPSFGSVGDGRVVFSQPEPVQIVPSSTVEVTGPLEAAYGMTTVLVTKDGIIAAGAMDHTPGGTPSLTSMVIRYKQATPTPTNLTALGAGPTAVALTWTPPAEGQWFGYAIERAKVNEDGTLDAYKLVGYAGQASTSFTDEDGDLEPGATYFYRVHAVDGGGVVPTFAGPAQASTDPDLSDYGLVETISLSPDGTTVRSGTTLVAGVKYVLRASGSFYALGPDGKRYLLDAEYVLANGLWQDTQTTTTGGTVDVGVALNGPGQLQFYKDTYEIDEGLATYDAAFTVVRTGGTVGAVTFHYRTVDGTGDGAAIDQTDYEGVDGDVTLADGVSTAVIYVPILHNPASGDRRFTLELTDPSATESDPPLATAEVTIGDVDATPKFDVSVDRQLVPAGESFVVTVTRHGNGHGDRTVHLTTGGGTAVSTTEAGHASDGDYDGIDLDIPFAANGSATWTKTILTHETAPAGRNFVITLKATDSPAILSQVGITLTAAAAAPTLNFEAPAYSAGEAAGKALVNLTLSAGLNYALTVPYTITGSAKPGADFTTAGSVTIPKGQTVWPIEVSLVNDRIHEPDETVTLTIGTPTGASVVLGSTTSTTLTITDDDPVAVLQWEAWNPQTRTSADEDGTLRPRIHRTGNTAGATTVYVTFDPDTAVAGTNYENLSGFYTFGDGDDYLAIDVPIRYDGSFSGKKEFDLVLSSPSEDAEISSDTGADSARIEISGTPTASPTTQTFTIKPDPYRFGEGQDTAQIWVKREGPDLSQSADVYYSTLAVPGTDTAVAGTDFTAAGVGASAHFAAGDPWALIEVPIISNGWADGTRTFRVTLTSSPDGTVDSTAVPVAILDDDPAAVAKFEVVYGNDPDTGSRLSNPVSEGTSTYELIVRRTGNTTGSSDVAYTVTGGTAEYDTDYTITGYSVVSNSGTVHFGPNDTQKSILITLYDNEAIDDPKKHIDFALTGASGGTLLGSDNTVRVNILDTGAAPPTSISYVSLDTTSYEAWEGGDAVLTLTRSGDTSHDVTVQWTTSPGTARELVDYGQRGSSVVLSGTVTFLAGQATATITIPTTADGRPEGTETFYVSLTGASIADGTTSAAAVLDGTTRATVAITEPAAVWIDSVEYANTFEINQPAYTAIADYKTYAATAEITLRRGGTPTQIATAASVSWTALDQYGYTWTGTAYFDAGQVTSSVRISAPRLSFSSTTVAYPTKYGTVYSDAVKSDRVDVRLEDPENVYIGGRSSATVTVWQRPGKGVPRDFASGGQSGGSASYSNMMLLGDESGGLGMYEMLVEADQTVGFKSAVYLVNEGVGEFTLDVVRSGETSGTLTVDYTTQDGTATTDGGDYDAAEGVLTFEPGETTKTITVRVRPDLIAGVTTSAAAEVDETFIVTLTNPSLSGGGTVAVDDNLGTATVVIGSLTDPDKLPTWGPHSEASDHGYQITIDGAQADQDGHLVLNYRTGAFTDFTTDVAGEVPAVAPITVQIYAPRPATVAQLTAVAHWGTSSTDRSINLAWKTPRDADKDDYYIIERSLDGGQTFDFLAAAAIGTTSYVDADVVSETPYAYRITARAGTLDSNPSNTAYAMLVNHAPRVEYIGTQIVHPDDTSFEYRVIASDIEDGANLTYSPLEVTDASGNPVSGRLAYDPANPGVIKLDNWTPSDPDVGQAFTVKVEVVDTGDKRTTRTFSLAVLRPRLTAPDVGTITASELSTGGTSVTLHSGAQAGLVYRWRFIPIAGGAVGTILNPDDLSPTVTFTKAGAYKVSLQVSRPDDPIATVTVMSDQFYVAQQPTNLLVSELPGDVDPDGLPFPAKFPGESARSVVGHSGSQWFVTTLYDQFGDEMGIGYSGEDGPHRPAEWALASGPGQSPIGTKSGQRVEFVASLYQAGSFTLTATASVSGVNITGSLAVNFAEIDPPTVAVSPDGVEPTGIRLKTVDLEYDGDASALRYYWSVVDHPEIGFANNGTNAAQATLARVPKAGTYEDLHIQLTVIDPNNGLRAIVDYYPPDLTISAEPTALRVTPTRPTVTTGGHVKLTATVVDQFGNPVSPQPTSLSWAVDGLGSVRDPLTDAPDPTGTVANYWPGTPPSSGSMLLGTVHVTAGGFSADVPINFGVSAPPTVSLKVDTVADPLTEDTGHAANLLDRPQAVKAIINDPVGGTINWQLTATPQGQNGEGTVLLTGTGPAGALPGIFGRIGTIAPTQLPDGMYILTLRVESDRGGSFVPTSASQIVQVRSAVKLGNVTLPVTDITQDVPNAATITVSRGYDSQRAGQDVGLGYGWTLDALTPALVSTQTVQYSYQDNTTPGDSSPGTSLAMNDLIYVTLPSGEEHVFAFRPMEMIDKSKIGAAYLYGVVTYLPHFVPVDGSITTLQPCNSAGEPRTDEDTLYWDSLNGYMFKSADNGMGYNPGLSTFGGYYLMTTVDGMRYVVNAATGRLHSQIDLQGRTQTFNENGATSTTVGARTYETVPTKVGVHITRIVTQVREGASTTELQEAIYGYDGNGDLTSVVVKDIATGAMLRSTQYTYDSFHHLTGVIDGLGVTVLSAEYDEVNGQLTRLTNTRDTAAKSSTGYSGDHASQTVTDPAGNLVSNEYDDHGNVTRSITTVTDPSGKVPLYYVVTVSDYGYGNPESTDDGKGADDQPRLVNGKYPDEWPTVNVLEHAYTSTPFVVPAARASDRFLSIDALKSHGYLKTYVNSNGVNTGQILWASMQDYDTNRRVLKSTSVLQGDGAYLITKYGGDAHEYTLGKPIQVNRRIDWVVSGTDLPQTTYHYAPSTKSSVNSGSVANPNVGLLISSVDGATGQTTNYIYGGDGIPGSGDSWGDNSEPTPALAPARALYGTYRDTIVLSEDPPVSTPLWLNLNGYYGYGDDPSFTPATATTPGGVKDLLAFTTDFTADPQFGLTTEPLTGVTTRYTYWPDGKVADVYKEWLQDGVWYKVLQSHTDYDAFGRVSKVYSQPDQETDIPNDGNGKHWKVYDLAGPSSLHTTTTYDPNGQVLDTTDVYGGVTHRVYDATGHLVQTLYPDGTETRTVYDAQGRVTWQTDRFASASAFDPETGEYISPPNATHTVYDHQGRTIATERYTGVRVEMVTDPATPLGATIYTSTLATAGTTVSTSSTIYDGLGRVVETIDAAGLRTGTIYYPNGQVRYTGVLLDSVSDKGTSPWYSNLPEDPALNVKFKRTNVTGTFSNGDTVTQDETGATATFLYDDGTYFHLLIQSGTWDASHSVRVYYSESTTTKGTADAGGNLTSLLDDLFVSYTPSYNDLIYGRPGEPALPPSGGIYADLHFYDASTDALGRTTRFYRDNTGRPQATLYADGSYDITYYSNPTSTYHSPVDQPNGWNPTRDGGNWALTEDDGWLWFNGNNDPIVPAGRSEVVKIAQRSPDSTGPILATIYLNDAAGRLTDAWLPFVDDATTSSTTKVRPHWHYTYDPNGNQLTQTDPNGHTTHFAYDSLGRRTSRTLPDNQVESWTYDSFGRTLTHVDFKGQTTAYEYDSLGRLSKEWRFNTGVTAINTSGLINTSAAWEHTQYDYDTLGRQYQVKEYVVSSLIRTETSTYDPITGQVASKTTPEGTVNYEYDPATGRHIETWTGTTKSAAGADTLYGYDRQGRLASVSVVKMTAQAPAAFPGSVRYDAAGNAIDTTLPTTHYTYDAVGNLRATVLPNGLTTTYTYDKLNRLTFEQVTRDDLSTTSVVETTPVATFDYNYLDTSASTTEEQHRLMIQDDGQRGGVVETRYAADGITVFSRTAIDYEYDADGRLTREVQDVGFAGAPVPTGDQDFTDTYAYDLNGNRLTKAHDVGSDTVVEETTRSVYGEINSSGNLVTPNGDDRLRWTITTDASGTETSRTEYRYDANGSTVFTQTTTGGVAGDDRVMIYDLRNWMVEADISDGKGEYFSVTSYAYDSSGRLVSRTIDDLAGGDILHSSQYLVDENNPTGYSQVLEEHHHDDTGDPQTSDWVVSSEIGLTIIAQAGYGPLTYFITDGHGSTRALTNYQGQVTSTQDYDAFGNALNFIPTDAPARPFYAGQVFDGVLGQYYMRARYYDQAIGRFSSQDSLTFGPGEFSDANLYLYVGGNPVMLIDPSGHFGYAEVATTTLMSAVLGGLSGGAISGAYKFAKTGSLAAAGQAALSGWAFGTLLGAGAGLGAGLFALGTFAAGAGASIGFTGFGISTGIPALGMSIGQVVEAERSGDSVDRAFAWAGLVLSVATLSLTSYSATHPGLFESSVPPGTATISQYKSRPVHFIIEIEGAEGTLATHQVMLDEGGAGTQIVKFIPGDMGNARLMGTRTIVVPNAGTAMAEQTAQLNAGNLGQYDEFLNSCVSHVCAVLNAGEVPGVPPKGDSGQIKFLVRLMKQKD